MRRARDSGDDRPDRSRPPRAGPFRDSTRRQAGCRRRCSRPVVDRARSRAADHGRDHRRRLVERARRAGNRAGRNHVAVRRVDREPGFPGHTTAAARADRAVRQGSRASRRDHRRRQPHPRRRVHRGPDDDRRRHVSRWDRGFDPLSRSQTQRLRGHQRERHQRHAGNWAVHGPEPGEEDPGHPRQRADGHR